MRDRQVWISVLHFTHGDGQAQTRSTTDDVGRDNRLAGGRKPSYLLHDRDAVFAGVAGTIAAMRIYDLVTAARSPWQNAYVERFIGSIRRECLDHVIVLTPSGLQRVVTDYVAYYMRSRTHLALDKDAPTPRPVMPMATGRIVAIPEVNGLHHRYDRAAA